MKIKRFITAFLSIFIPVLFTFLTACNHNDSSSNSINDELSSHIHILDDGNIIKEATCTENGIIIYSCKDCDYQKEEIINAINHDYRQSNSVPSDCKTLGFIEYTCNRCDDSYKEYDDTLLAHVEVVDQEVKPTCTESGLTKGIHCSVCNEVLIKQEIIEPLGHSIVKDEENKATCSFNGLTEGSHCEICNEVIIKQEIIPALDHDFSKLVNKEEASCQKEGFQTYACIYCDIQISETIDKLKHVISNITYIKEPTCIQEGLECGYCDLCDEYVENSIEAVGHTPSELIHTGDYCNGYQIGYSKCIICNEVLYDVGHIYEKSVIQPTCENDGQYIYTCSECNNTYTETINALGHVSYDYEILKQPTCKEEGILCKYCINCNECIDTITTNKLSHQFISEKKEDGILYSCSNCDYSYFQEALKVFTVSFVSDNENIFEPLLVSTDEAITLPRPSKDGYEFAGWYYDDEFTNLCDDTAQFYKDTTLYAGWYVSKIEASINSNNVETNVSVDYSFNVTSNIALNDSNISQYILIEDINLNSPNIYISNIDGNIYSISSDEYIKGMNYCVTIFEPLTFTNTKEKELWFSIESENTFNIKYKENVLYLNEKDIFNVYEDNDENIYIFLRKDLLNAEDKVVIYSADIYDVSCLIEVITETTYESLFVYLIKSAKPEDIFEEYNFYTTGSLDVSNIEFEQNLQESLVEELRNSEVYNQFEKAAIMFSRNINDPEYKYEFKGISIEPGLSSSGSNVTIVFNMAAKFNKVLKTNNQVVSKFNVTLQILSQFSFEVTASATSINKFSFIITSTNTTKIDLYASAGAYDSTNQLNYFKEQFLNAKKEGKFTELDSSSAALEKEKKIGKLDLSFYGLRFKIEVSNLLSFESVGELGISTQVDCIVKTGVRRTSSKNFQTIKSFEAYASASLYSLGKIEISDVIEIKISASICGIAEVYVSLSAGPYIEAGGMFTLSVSADRDITITDGGYLAIGMKVDASIGVKIETKIKIKIWFIKVDKTITILDKKWSLYSQKSPFFSLGETKSVLYFIDYDEYITKDYYCDSTIDLDDIVNKQVVVQDLLNMSKDVEIIDGKYYLDGIYDGVSLSEDGVLKISIKDFKDLKIKIKLCTNNTYKFIHLTLYYKHHQNVSSEIKPTCTEDGSITYTCTSCNETHTEIIDALGHDYSKTITNPTCEEKGYTTYICNVCNDSYVSNYVDATGHTYSNNYSYDETHHWKESTCEHSNLKDNYEEHNMQDNKCVVCEYEKMDNYTEELQFMLSDDGTYYMITGLFFENEPVSDVVIPKTYKGLPVTHINENAFNNSYFSTISLPDSITYIGDYAFGYCNSLTTINLPDSITYIGSRAFENCSLLTSIYIPKNVEYIGTNPFFNCKSLSEIIVDENNNYYDCRENSNTIIETSTNTIIAGCNSSIIPSDIICIGDSAFYACSNLTFVDLPNCLETISDNAFVECVSLANIVIPDNVTYIGYGAFYGCSSLQEITLGKGLSNISERAFYGCSSLTNLKLPSNIESIGYSSFERCSSLANIIIENPSIRFLGYAFNKCKSSASLYYNGTLTDWCNLAFDSSSNPLSSIDSLYILDENGNYYELTEVVLDKDVNSYQFYGYKKLTSVILLEGVNKINSNAFYNCSNLSSITLPSSITDIQRNAFYNCNSISSVYYNGSQEQWNEINIKAGNDYLINSIINYQ